MRRPNNSKLLVFDFDGTIADTMVQSIKIINHLADEFGFRQIKDDELEWLRSRTLWQFVRHLKIPIRKISKILHRAQEEMTRNILEVRLIPEMSEVIHELRTMGHSIGIMTSNTLENVSALLKQNDLEVFDFTHCSVKLRKKARNLKRIRRKHKVPRRNVLYIGDECRDVRAARKARVNMAAVTWGFNNGEALSRYRPQFLLSEPQELLKICEGFLSPTT